VSKSTGATAADVPLSDFMGYYLTTTYLCAGIAYAMSRIIFNYGRRLRKAREIGAYRLSRMLGKGGMGEVWQGEHRMLARPAAIKLIRAEALGGELGAGSVVLQRFEREAQATAALRSQHTIQLYDFGVADDGSFYYVMELLEGMSLRELVDRFGPVAPARAIHLLRQVCHSLGEAHERGMVHRDVKPANIFVCRLGPDLDFVKVLDFGLVKDAGDGAALGPQLTEAGVVTGTPAFMAPEMTSGASIDGRADIYALGCVGYWLLTGQPVFPSSTPVAMLLDHVQTTPRPMSERTELDVPPDLERVILWCLEKDAADRPQSTAELARALIDCEPPDHWSPEDAADWWSLHDPLYAVAEGGMSSRAP
jgi:serine/threonine-protein kinase